MPTLTQQLIDGDRAVIVAMDHPLYSWPCRGLEDREAFVRTAVDAGASGFIASYGTLRDHLHGIDGIQKILKLDLSTISVRSYELTEYRQAWTIEDAVRLGVDAVLTYVQVGGPEELTALTTAAQVAARADEAGIPYVCEAIPVEGSRFPNPYDPEAIAGATRAAIELGAHVVKTSLPQPPEGLADSTAFGVPVLVAGGDPVDAETYLDGVRTAVDVGAAGVAVGRNAWGSNDPAAMIRRIVEAVSRS